MHMYKSLGLVGLAVASLFATQAFATPTTCPAGTQGSPVCIAPVGMDGAGTGLVDILAPYNSTTNHNGVFSKGGADPYTQQKQSSYWSVNSSSGSISTIMLQIAAYNGHDTFGIFDPNDPSNKLALFTGGVNGGQAALSVYTGGGYAVNFGAKTYFSTTNYFGYYLTTPSGTYYSAPNLNEAGGTTYPDGTPHMVAYQGDNSSVLKPMNGFPGGVWDSNEYILAWEDLPWGASDLDYNDFIVMVESVHPVPEPAVLGMFGLGVLLIGGLVALRRRYAVV